ncbi:MAG: nicotinate (nicotinamide) nucleotide adenylyltransferase [Campylobacteraceae bacterium]
MTVELFGGSFDPPHIGHEIAVNAINDSLHVNRIFVTPTFISPFKKEYFVKPYLRLFWLKKLFTSYKNVTILDYEIRQHKPTPTIQTVKYIQHCYNPSKIYLVVGADILESFHLWHSYSELMKMVEVVVLTRGGIKVPKDLKKIDINVNIQSSNLRVSFNEKFIPIQIRKDVVDFYKEKNGKKN